MTAARPTVRAQNRFAVLPEWVLYSDVSAQAVRLYCVLGRRADRQTGKAAPGRAYLARQLRCSADTVDRAMRELRGIGAIEIRYRYRDEAAKIRLPNEYVVMTEDPGRTDAATPTDAATLPAPVPPPGRKDAATPGRTDAAVVLRGQPNLDPLEKISSSADADGLLPPPDPKPTKRQVDAMFARWYEVYPRKKGRGAARREFERALKRASFHDLIVGVERYRDDPARDPTFTAHPATWLHQDRWLDEPDEGRSLGDRIRQELAGEKRSA